MLTEPAPFFAAFGASAAIAFIAWRLRSLSLSGAVAAMLVGCAALSASWGMGFYLVSWFALATVLSKIGKQRKAARVSGVIEKGSQRDAWQVLANGGVFCVCSLSVVYAKHSGAPENQLGIFSMLAGAGSLAAAGADTWATEIGTLYGGAPWSLRTFSRVPTGTSGAITLAGTLAMVAGALVSALLAFVFALVMPSTGSSLTEHAGLIGTVAVGGIAGALADTLVGAWWQERRWCPRCTMETEQRVHRCGTVTIHHRGIRGLNNDWVNLLCAFIGAIAPFVTLVVLTLIFEAPFAPE